MEWISQQSWSNGKVATTGASADGLNEFTEIIGQYHPWLSGQFIIFASSSGYDVAFPGGAARQSLISLWIGSTVPSQAPAKIHEVYENEAPGKWWDALNGTGNFHHVDFPSTLWAGWYDIFLVGNLLGFEGYQHKAKDGFTGMSRLVVDPLGHCQAGAEFFPKNTILGRVALPLLQAYDMFDGKSTIPESVKAVTFYVMGADPSDDLSALGNYWTTQDDFPAFTPTKMYLQAHNNLTGTLPPAGYSADTYTYNPANPVPSNGGNNLKIECGPRNQAAPGYRQDVITFQSAPLTEALWLTGPINAVLYVSSNATDTDFTAKLVDVYPNGADMRLIQDGIVRMRWRDRTESNLAKPMSPGRVYEVELSLWNTSYVFSPGHRLRVDISSSNFPRFSVNPNNFCPMANEQCAPNVTARNTIYHSAEHPSHISLPVVQSSQLPEHGVLDSSLAALKKRMQVSPRFVEYIATRALRDGHLTMPHAPLRGSPVQPVQALLALSDDKLHAVATRVLTELTLDSTLAATL